MRNQKEKYEAILAEERLIARAQGVLGEAIRRSGLSQKQLARRLDVSEAAISKMLGSAPNLTLRRFARVMHALGEKGVITSERLLRKQTVHAVAEVKRSQASWAPLEHNGLFAHANENHEIEACEGPTVIPFKRGAERRISKANTAIRMAR